MKTFAPRIRCAARVALGTVALGIGSFAPAAQAATQYVAPGIMQHGQNLGLEAPTTALNLTVWLNLHNRSELDARVEALYKAGSPTYHQWLKPADLAKYAPTAAELAAVEKELAAHNLKVTYKDQLRLAIKVTGAVSDVESAFGVKISKYKFLGETVHVSSTEPTLGGAAAGLVHHVAGLNSGHAQPLFKRPVDPLTRQPFAGVKISKDAKPSANGVIFSGQCFYAPTTTTLTGVSSADGSSPVTEVLSGLNYGANPANTDAGTLAPCAYSSSQIQGFYGLDVAYGRGYDGAGQTIVILDEGTNAQALPDANVFNAQEGLPALDATNYTELNPFNAQLSAYQYGADAETDLDVEWAHATAPGAKIVLIDVGGGDGTNAGNEDFQAAELYAVENHLGNVISLSYGLPEYILGNLDTDIFGLVGEFAAASGIAVNVSSGDDGDFTDEGLPMPDTNGFGDSPWVTSVGGTSIGQDLNGQVYHLGWGNNIGTITGGAGVIVDPPNAYNFFFAGSGGGASQYWSKPAFESSLPGTQRLVPDVSALADPYTGAEFVYDDGAGTPILGAVGGTSLAAPIFSGMWSILNQYAGTALGQAAPYIAQTPYPLLTDVLPISYGQNLTAKVTDPSGTTTYSAEELAQPLQGEAGFILALWQEDTAGDYASLSFGTDSSLLVTQGWDDVTGWGTPNMGVIFSVLP